MICKRRSVSIAMATYNGEKYIGEQLDSIIAQIDDNDEIIISDDGSTDRTLEILDSYMCRYKQIKVVAGPHKGPALNFRNAILNCTKDIVFLSDQDDIWQSDKINTVCDIFEQHNVKVVLHNAVIGVEKQLICYKRGVIRNIIKSSYWGCCMAVQTKFAQSIFKHSRNYTAHDQIIGLIAELKNAVYFSDEKLIIHRLHDSNKTKELSLIDKVGFRIKICKDLFYLMRVYED